MEPNSTAEQVSEGQAATSEALQATRTMESNLTAEPVSGDPNALIGNLENLGLTAVDCRTGRSTVEQVLEDQAASSDLEAASSENPQATGTVEPNLTAKPVSGDQDALDEAVQVTRTMALNPIAQQVLDIQKALGRDLKDICLSTTGTRTMEQNSEQVLEDQYASSDSEGEWSYSNDASSDHEDSSSDLQDASSDLEDESNEDLQELKNGIKVSHVYDYAWGPYSEYVNKYCKETIKVLFLGMDPGPQRKKRNGVPFGNTNKVKEWLKIEGAVNQHATKHQKQKPNNGFGQGISKKNSSILWGLFENLSGTTEFFFRNCFVHNYCPLVFLEGGQNIALDKLPVETRNHLEPHCDEALLQLIKATKAEIVVGIGQYAHKAAKRTLLNKRIPVLLMPHSKPEPIPEMHVPKPITPVILMTHPAARENTREWEEKVIQQLKNGHVYKYLENPLKVTSRKVLKDQFALGKALQEVTGLEFQTGEFGGEVTHVYNLYEYAWDPYSKYVNKYCKETKVLFLGMNPGPDGMMQNGVPFGNRDHVVNWLGIKGKVKKPTIVHPKRPILGFGQGIRPEISGRRLWGLFKSLYGTPEVFFQNCFVHNYCPLIFLQREGQIIGLEKLPFETRNYFELHLDEALFQLIEATKAEIVVGIGEYAHKAAKRTLVNAGFPVLLMPRSMDQMDIPKPITSLVLMTHPGVRGNQPDGVWMKEAKEQLSDQLSIPLHEAD